MSVTLTIVLVIVSLLILGGFLLLVFSLCHAASVADDNAEEILAQLKETEETNKPTKKNSP
jgi:cell division protein FtsX